jgi:hypothetical protein
MGLVDGKPPRADLAKPRREPLRQKALGRDEQQAQLAPPQEPPGLVGLVLACRRVEGRGANAEAPHLLDLVAHQRDQRRDHDGERAIDDRRQLVAHRLAGAGRHDGEHVLAGEHGGDDLGLAGAEVVIAEDGFQRGAGRFPALTQRADPPGAAGGRRGFRRACRGGSACPCGR